MESCEDWLQFIIAMEAAFTLTLVWFALLWGIIGWRLSMGEFVTMRTKPKDIKTAIIVFVMCFDFLFTAASAWLACKLTDSKRVFNRISSAILKSLVWSLAHLKAKFFVTGPTVMSRSEAGGLLAAGAEIGRNDATLVSAPFSLVFPLAGAAVVTYGDSWGTATIPTSSYYRFGKETPVFITDGFGSISSAADMFVRHTINLAEVKDNGKE